MARQQAVEYFIPDHPGTTRNLRGLLNERIEILSQVIMSGQSSDWADYKHRVGKIEGLREAIATLDEIEKEDR